MFSPLSLKLHAERTLVSLLKAAYADSSDAFRWSADAATSGVKIAGEQSPDAHEKTPAIIVHIGDLADYKGSIDHIKEWSAQLERRVFVDQSSLRITHLAENIDDAQKLAERSRQILLFAQQSGDLGRHSIFGLQSPSVSASQASLPGGKRDNVFASYLTSAFMVMSRTKTTPSESSPLWDDMDLRSAVGGEIAPGDGVVSDSVGPGTQGWPSWFSPGAGGTPGQPAPVSAGPALVLEARRDDQARIEVSFDRPLENVEAYGFYLLSPRGESEEVSGFRDRYDASVLKLDVPSGAFPSGSLLGYAGGNVQVRSADGELLSLASFTSLPVQG